ncbi:hypothetical protein GCM10020218_044520 [Dactylosporangium vinaceum]
MPLLVALVTRRVWPAVVTAVATVALAACVLPRWISDSSPEPGGPGLRVLSVNMLFGGADPGAIVGLVRQLNVDLVALQEYTPEAQSALRAAGLEAVLPNAVAYPKPGVTGSACTAASRSPISATGSSRRRSGRPGRRWRCRGPRTCGSSRCTRARPRPRG